MTDVQKVLVPASLDLVERAKLGINGLLGSLDPAVDYEPYFLTFFAARPAYMIHWSSMPSGVLPKYVEALALLRNMTGSTEQKDQEDAMLQAVIANCADDGMIYDRVDPRRPWNVGVGYGVKSWNEDYANLAGNGRLVNGFDWMYQLTGDETWKKSMQRTAERTLQLAIVKGDYAYYPNVECGNDFSYPRTSGWVHTKEPQGPQEGGEGATTFYLALPIRGWTRWYKQSGDERFLDMCRRFTRFVMQPKFYGGIVELEPGYGAERGHFWGHFHGNLAALRGILEYALIGDDYRAKEFVRDAYEWSRQNLCVRLGQGSYLEGCCTADLTALGIQLSDAGLGDYRDDVDAVVRNSLPEAQASDIDLLRQIGEASPRRPEQADWGAAYDWRFNRGILREPLAGQECYDNVLQRAIGGFSHLMGGRYQVPYLMHCCTGNGNQAWYYAWEAVTRCQGDAATVNLLFNRFSPWLDVLSYMPFEGKVVFKNKTARRISVRVPAWVKRSALRWTLGGTNITPTWTGAYAVVDGIRPGAQLTMEFPLEREKVTLTLPDLNGRPFRGSPKVTAYFKGSTCIGLEPRGEEVHGEDPAWYPQFHRPEFHAETTPMKEVDYYIPDKLIRWY